MTTGRSFQFVPWYRSWLQQQPLDLWHLFPSSTHTHIHTYIQAENRVAQAFTSVSRQLGIVPFLASFELFFIPCARFSLRWDQADSSQGLQQLGECWFAWSLAKSATREQRVNVYLRITDVEKVISLFPIAKIF